LAEVALVTGGGRGIGENIARELAAAGMQVIVTGRTRDQVENVAAEIGGRALVGDVSKRDDVERWATEAGDVHLLVCNAGISGPDDDFADPDDARRALDERSDARSPCPPVRETEKRPVAAYAATRRPDR